MIPKGTSFDLIGEISSLLRGQAENEIGAIGKCCSILSNYYKITMQEANKIVLIWAEIIYQRNVNEI